MMKGVKRRSDDINASSMADITFLLLIFFLVTTTISSDKGIKFVLPPKADNAQEVKLKGVVNIFLDDNGNVLLGQKGKEEETPIQQVGVKLQSLSRQIASQGDSIIVSIKTTEGSSYKNYVDILDQITSAKIKRISLAQ